MLLFEISSVLFSFYLLLKRTKERDGRKRNTRPRIVVRSETLVDLLFSSSSKTYCCFGLCFLKESERDKLVDQRNRMTPSSKMWR